MPVNAHEALKSCCRMADLLVATFGDEPGKKDIVRSGTHAGMAATAVLEPMILLYAKTGDEKYLDFCHYIVRRADAGPGILTRLEQSGTVQKVGNGKAYEMMSNYVGLVEYWRTTGNQRALAAAELAWKSVQRGYVFITGAPNAHEHFTEPHTLIPTGACTETCVQVIWVHLTWQLLRATGEPKYAAMLHRHLYNHMLAAQHPDGIQWCYFTTMGGRKGFGPRVHCCGSSGPRAIAMIPSIAYMSRPEGVTINLYETSTFRGTVGDSSVSISQTTDYPWSGQVSVDVTVDQPTQFGLQLLIPDFAANAQVQVDQTASTLPTKPGQYTTIQRKWTGTTRVELTLQMPVLPHERNGRHCLSRGPIILALEQIQPGSYSPLQVRPSPEALSTSNQLAYTADRKVRVKGTAETGDRVELIYGPYCEAGTDRRPVYVWLPAPPEK